MKIKHTTHITHALGKAFGIRRSRVLKFRKDQKVIHRQFVCSTEGYKSRDETKEIGCDVFTGYSM